MTLVLSADQLTDMQGDVGLVTDPLDPNYGLVFTDTELNRLYNRANGAYLLGVILAFDQLLADSAKWVNYVEGQTQEARSDRFKQIMQLVEYKRQQWIATEGYAMVHIRPVPTPCRDRPYDRYPGYNRLGGWGRRCGPY